MRTKDLLKSMKIKKMVIEDFRCFKDEQTIEFDTDGIINYLQNEIIIGNKQIAIGGLRRPHFVD